MFKIRHIYYLFFILGLFFFPFNEKEISTYLGEFRSDAGAVFFLLGIFVLLINTFIHNKIFIPYRSVIFRTIILFLIWCIIATLLNGQTVITNYFKLTTGVNRFLRQYLSLLMSSIGFFLLFWNVFVQMSIREILYKIRKVLLFSLIFGSIYGFLETLVSYFGLYFIYPILELFNYFPFIDVHIHGGGKISSFSYEPPYLAIYLITISGWMFSYILTEKGIIKFIPAILVLLLTFFSGSRTGLLVIFFQLCIFITIMYKNKSYRKYIVYSATSLLIIFSILIISNGEKVIKAVSEKIESLDFKNNLKNNVSNQSRFGMQYASLQVFKENPIAGVGYGQQTYHARYHYPGWATNNNYEFSLWYQNPSEKSFPPAYNFYTRMLAETGLIGIFILLSLIFLCIVTTRKLIKNSTGEKQVLAYILLISFSGLFVNWLQFDSFRVYGIWICIAILIKLQQTPQINE